MQSNTQSKKKSKTACLYAEFALTPRQHATGLMGRKYLKANHGMLFDFGKEKPLSFWMANTYIPLQIAFIDQRGKIGKIADMTPLSTRSISSDGKYRYALEVNEGWFNQNGIQVGAQVNIPEDDTLSEGEVLLPDDMDQSPESPITQLPDPTQQNQEPVRPDLVIRRSHRDILDEISNYPSGFKIKLEYIAKSGKAIPLKTIETPFEFSDTANGKTDGLVTAWDSQKGRFSSFIIDNIVSIRDYHDETIINTNQQIEDAFAKSPMSPRDQQEAIGIMSRPAV